MAGLAPTIAIFVDAVFIAAGFYAKYRIDRTSYEATRSALAAR